VNSVLGRSIFFQYMLSGRLRVDESESGILVTLDDPWTLPLSLQEFLMNYLEGEEVTEEKFLYGEKGGGSRPISLTVRISHLPS
jgi:transcriptional regulator with AAA-type ATPase domain